MKDTREIHESPEKEVIKTPEKKIDTFDNLRTSHKPDRIDTFDDIRKQGSDKSIITFDDINVEKEHEGQKIKLDGESIENEKLSSSVGKVYFSEGRHRAYVAAKEGYDDIPVKLNDICVQKDGRKMLDNRGITHVFFDKDILNSEDMQNLTKEHDFKKWEQGMVEHKGYTYDDHIKEFQRLKECQELVRKGHSEKEIETLLGKDHAETHKRFYETRPIKVDRTIGVG